MCWLKANIENKMETKRLEKQIGYIFQDKSKLENALRHTSYANEHKVDSNEKLEFLGDSILEFVSSEYLYQTYPNLKEGEMTKVRAAVVCEQSLYQIAKEHSFSDFLLVGRSERASGGNKKPAILADSVEAVIAAMYLDGGLEPAKRFILDNLKKEIELATKHVGLKDYKTVLQEKLQEQGEVHIHYEIIGENGPDHNKTFEAEVFIENKSLATGKGKSKKEAEMQAAKKALENLT